MQGAVTFCGLVAGGVDLNNYQLNAEYALTQLLPGAAGVQIRDFASMAAGSAAGTQLNNAVTSAQATAAGRARIALTAALLNETDWTTGQAPPASGDYAAQELQEEEMLTSGQLPFIESGRYMISLAEGGDSGYNIGVNYGALAGSSALLRQVYVNAIGHCNFTDADYVSAIDAMNGVVSKHHWTSGVTVDRLNQAANALDLGGGNFTTYRPTPLDVQRGQGW